jgi:hypothetical protein
VKFTAVDGLESVDFFLIRPEGGSHKACRGLPSRRSAPCQTSSRNAEAQPLDFCHTPREAEPMTAHVRSRQFKGDGETPCK